MSIWNEEESFYDKILISESYLLEGEEEHVKVKFFTNEKSARKCLIKNQKYSLPIRLLNFIIKLLPCLLYIIQVINDDPSSSVGCCHICQNHSINKHGYDEPDISIVHWQRLIFVNRTYGLWITQIVCAILNIIQFIMVIFLTQKTNIVCSDLIRGIILEILSSVLFITSMIKPKTFRCLFIPSFMNCWLAKAQFENLLDDLNKVFQRKPRAFFHRILKVISSTSCIIFTSVCGFQHLQRGGYRHFTLFESIWFVVVTFTTVGYGDYKPDIWLTQVFMIIMIIISLIVMPVQLQRLVFDWMEKHKLGGTYSQYRAKRVKHVVMCVTSLEPDVILDSLNEFYANKIAQNHHVCILSSSEMNSITKKILKSPNWKQRVLFIKGSALSDVDLARCRMQDADGCFISVPKTCKSYQEADQLVIMQSWAIKDFAPRCRQFVQLYKPENKIHVKFAEHVLCLHNFKYALLGNNSLVPGMSTMVTFLIHTTRGEEGQNSLEEWQRIYGRCCGNELYDVKLKDSKFFKEYNGKSFQITSYSVYKKFGITLVGVSSSEKETMILNPGSQFIMKETDICYYLSISEEENISVIQKRGNSISISNNDSMTPIKTRTATNSSSCPSPTWSILGNDQIFQPDSRKLLSRENSILTQTNYILERPKIFPYYGNSSCLCHVMPRKRDLCCLDLLKKCSHEHSQHVIDHKGYCKSVIVCGDSASFGLYNFIIPLRNHCISECNLKPIVLLLEKEPESIFLESICQFPLVYWMLGSFKSVDDLLKAGVTLADQIVIPSKECVNANTDMQSDFNYIIAVQEIHLLFPHLRIITEINDTSNMRFTLFSPEDEYSLKMSKLEKKERVRGSHISYLYRLPFAAGNVFSTNMLNTLLYQAFSKPYIVSFLQLLLGIDHNEGSAHLGFYQIKEKDLSFKTYGKLFQVLILSASKIPIGVYRTIQREKRKDEKICMEKLSRENNENYSQKTRDQMICKKLEQLGLPTNYLTDKDPECYYNSFVMLNPQYNLEIQKDDIIYLLCPPSPGSTPASLSANMNSGFDYQSTIPNSDKKLFFLAGSRSYEDRSDQRPLLDDLGERGSATV